jgi:hypothetical protein
MAHLKSATPERRPERNQSIAETMWPTLGPQPKPPTNPYRESLLRGLKEANANIDARRRERGRR